MRVVLDTNVLVSAALKHTSLPAAAVRSVALSGTLIKSTATEEELLGVLDRAHLVSLIPPSAREWVRAMIAAAELVTITEHITACRDSDDDKCLELAVNGHADVIVSGDADLLALNPFREIPIIGPATFVGTATRLS